MGNQELGIQVTAELSDAISNLQELLEKILNIPDSKDTTLGVNVEGQDTLDGFIQEYQDIADKDVNIDTSVTGDADAEVKTLADDADAIDGKDIGIDAQVTGDATKEMSDLQTEADELDNKQVNIDVNTSGDASENLQEDSESADSVSDALISAATAASAYKFGMDGLSYQSYIGQAVAFTSATNDQRAAMEEAVRSNSSARYKVDDLAEAMDYLGKQTGDANEATSLFGTEMSYVKNNGADLESSVTKLTNLYKLYGLNADEASDATTTLNGEILKSGYTGDEFLNLTSKASLELKNMGFSLQDTGAIVSAFGQSGVNASDAMRAMRGGFATFVQDFSTSNSDLSSYESKIQSLGVSTRDANGNLRSQKDVLSDLLVAFSKMPDGPEKTQLAMELFGTSAGKVIGNLNTNYQSVEDSANSSSDAQVQAAKKVRQETQDPYQWLINQLQLIASYLGISLSQLFAYAGTVAGLAIFKFRHQIVDGLKSLPSDIADTIKNVKIADSIEKEVRTDVINKAFKEDAIKAEQVLEEARNPIKTKVTNIVSDIKNKFGELKDIKIGDIDVSTPQTKINDFVDAAKVKLGELKDSNVWSKIFGDEKGTVTTSTSKINSFVDGAKGKIGELDGYNVYDRIFKDTGQGDKAVSKIGTLVGQIESKLGELDKYSPTAKVTPTNVNTETPTPTIGEGESTEGTSIWDRVKGGLGKIPGSGELADGLLNGLYTWIKVGSGKGIGYSLGTTLFDMLGMGAADAGVFLGMDLPGNPLYNLENNQPLIDWDPINQLKADMANAGNKNVPGSLADQLNLPGFLKGQGIDLQSSYKMPDWSSLSSGFNTAKSTIQTGWNQLSSFVTSHIPKINWNTIFQGATGLINTVKNAWNSFVQWVTSHVPKVNWGSIQQGLQGAVTWVKTQWNNFTGWITSHLPKLNIHWPNIQVGLQGAVQWVQGQWNGFTGWLSSHVPKVPTPNWPDVGKGLGGAVQWVKTEWNNFMGWLGTLPAKMQSYGGQIVHGLEQGILNGIPGLRSALSVIQGMTETNSPPKEGPLSGVSAGNWANWGSQLINGFSSGISSGQGIMNSALAGIENITSGFLGNMTSVASNLFSTGVSMVNNLASGLSAGVPDLSAVFSQISNMFPHSPPKTGPLSEIKAENMKSWTQSIALSGVEGLSQFTNYMGSMIKVPNLPTIRSPAALNSTADKNSGSGITVVVQSGAVQINGNASKDVVTNAGTYLGDGIAASNLSRQANNRGLSVINVIR